MAKIRNLKGGVWYRPVDTAAGKAGWHADITYEQFTPRRNSKGVKSTNQTIRLNWTQRLVQFGPCATELEVRAVYEPKYRELWDLANKSSGQK